MKFHITSNIAALLFVAIFGFGWPVSGAAIGSKDGADSPGKSVYVKANCIGCHKWHGGGGGGYGGAARSLRDTPLDAEGLKLVIRCGRPFTGMPYHERGAYKGQDDRCYNTSAESLGEQGVPPRARSFLRERQLNAVVDYVLNELKGRGEPTLEECESFWGESARQCQSMGQ